MHACRRGHARPACRECTQEPNMSRRYPPVSLIGAPTDIGAGDRGALMGPDALRIAGLGAALIARVVAVAVPGNRHGPSHSCLGPVSGYGHLQQARAIATVKARVGP